MKLPMTMTWPITAFIAGTPQELFFALAVTATLATFALLVVTVSAEVGTRRISRGGANRRPRPA